MLRKKPLAAGGELDAAAVLVLLLIWFRSLLLGLFTTTVLPPALNSELQKKK
jgi:hypothetical protein